MTTNNIQDCLISLENSAIDARTKDELRAAMLAAKTISDAFPEGDDNRKVLFANNAVIGEAIKELILEMACDFPIDYKASAAKVDEQRDARELGVTVIANMLPNARDLSSDERKQEFIANLQLLGYPVVGIGNDHVMREIALTRADRG